ncbi:hypothetical protein [Rhizobium etli]|uniref:hypothetical protein n=1 Tax=Rhizobium etli TaxID=29449 RepID=UPI0002E9D96A|nr:hypothetical protein [Rhizobium sp. IE4771]
MSMSVLYHIPPEDEYRFVQCSNADDATLKPRGFDCCRFYQQGGTKMAIVTAGLVVSRRLSQAKALPPNLLL